MVDWREELHLRGEGGLFAGAGAVGVARELERDRQAADVEQLARLRRFRVSGKDLDEEGHVRITPGRKWIDKVPGFPDETWHAHFSDHPDKGGVPSEERATFHRLEIIEPAFENVRQPEPDEQKVAILMMGAPASGKSSMVAGLNREDFVVINPDDVKDKLPEYREGLKQSARNSAKMSHEESSYVAKQIRERAIEEGKHLLVDGTGFNPNTYLGLIDKLHAQGYRVSVKMADLNYEEGMGRMKERAEATGRWVPPEIVTKSYERIPGNFERISRAADDFALFDTRVRGGPKLVWSGGKDKPEQIHDEARVAEFKSRAAMQQRFRPRIETEAREESL
jgi:predicted ABC-type ATPase